MHAMAHGKADAHTVLCGSGLSSLTDATAREQPQRGQASRYEQQQHTPTGPQQQRCSAVICFAHALY